MPIPLTNVTLGDLAHRLTALENLVRPPAPPAPPSAAECGVSVGGAHHGARHVYDEWVEYVRRFLPNG
jgi:hypothetical protein